MKSSPPRSASEAPEADSLLQMLRRENTLDVERSRQIYCNRDLSLAKIEAVGFDMDYTLANYHQEELDALSVRLTLERLVRERDYPDDILDIEPRPDFAIRGLVVDKFEGNILKMDGHRHVGKVYHGFRELTDEERHRYRNETIRLNTHERFVLIDTLFALPEAFLYAAIIDWWETARGGGDRDDWAQVFQDIRHCIDLAHRDGSIKSAIMGDLDRYIEPVPELGVTLHKFRSSGKRLFLLTNSYARYSNCVMTHILDDALPEYPSWRNYFDVIITGAKKPTFFTGRDSFFEVDDEGNVVHEEHDEFERGRLYQGGNLVDFERITGMGGETVCYIGDHIYGDIVRSKKSSAWRTVMIVQEMETELRRARELRDDIARVDELDAEIQRLTEEIAFDQNLANRLDRGDGANGVDDPNVVAKVRGELSVSRDSMRRRRKELLAELDRAEEGLEAHFNPYWGLIFKLGNENTLFGEQVEDYACLYTSRVSNFLNYSPMHYFRSPRQPMPHERY